MYNILMCLMLNIMFKRCVNILILKHTSAIYGRKDNDESGEMNEEGCCGDC